MTELERIAKRNIKGCFNYEIGAMYNSFLDGETDFPTLEEMKETIYILAMHDMYAVAGRMGGCAPREMRFAGREFCENYIDWLFDKDDDVAEIPWKEEV